MAGNYMDAPATRVAYDRDGSVGSFASLAGSLTALTVSQLRALNSEDDTGVAMPTANRLAIVFPVPMDIAAVFLATSPSGVGDFTLQTSKDTTTGLDGTWETHAVISSSFRSVKPAYRQAASITATIPGASSTAVRGVRLVYATNTTVTIRAFHIYADISAAATTDRIAFWHPDVDEEMPPAYFDWGNAPRGSSADRTFRVKNLSADKTANDITLYVEALTPGVPSVAGMHLISENGGSTFLTSITIDELAPGEVSDELILRRVVPTNASVSVWSARVAADVLSWT